MAVSTRSASAATEAINRELVFTRVFDPPRAREFINPVCEIDVRQGGAIGEEVAR